MLCTNGISNYCGPYLHQAGLALKNPPKNPPKKTPKTHLKKNTKNGFLVFFGSFKILNFL
jgi:hypothetical protein